MGTPTHTLQDRLLDAALQMVRSQGCAAWAKAMAGPRMQAGANPMRFDGKRLIYGGFELLMQA